MRFLLGISFAMAADELLLNNKPSLPISELFAFIAADVVIQRMILWCTIPRMSILSLLKFANSFFFCLLFFDSLYFHHQNSAVFLQILKSKFSLPSVSVICIPSRRT